MSFSSVLGQSCDKTSAKYYLDSLFEKGSYKSYDSTIFPNYSREVNLIKSPTLKKLLPDYCFFSTTFFSTYYEYMSVETLLAFSRSDKKKSLLIHSPVFTTENPFFIQLFYGLKTSDTTQSVQLASEITSIFSQMTFAGHFHRLVNLKDKKIISFELWHNDLSWRIYDFYYDINNTLKKIDTKGGVKRGEIQSGYKRM